VDRNRLTLILLIGLAWLSACGMPAPLAASPAAPSATAGPPSPSPSPTATIVWFPPTATFTPAPTVLPLTPTPALPPGIGQVLLQDDFSQAGAWQLYDTTTGKAAQGNQRLTLTNPGQKSLHFSLRQEPQLSDFYLEITASPNLCKGQDEYGVMLRVASTADFYRLGLSCDGQARLDRVAGGAASSPQPWTPSGAVPPGAPSRSRLGVWAKGDQMRFYVNGQEQFQVRDPLIPAGLVGVYVRATGENPVSVSFSDLVIYSLEP
jgi:hypothetical protein